MEGLSDLVGEAWCCGGEAEEFVEEDDDEAEADFERLWAAGRRPGDPRPVPVPVVAVAVLPVRAVRCFSAL